MQATREKNGIYLSAESYNTLVNENQSRKDSLDEVGRAIQAKETTLKQVEEKFQQQQQMLKDTSSKLDLTLVCVDAFIYRRRVCNYTKLLIGRRGIEEGRAAAVE